jgi:hypothetical protein
MSFRQTSLRFLKIGEVVGVHVLHMVAHSRRIFVTVVKIRVQETRAWQQRLKSIFLFT